MTRGIKESDWKLLRRLHTIALERFCQRVIEEINRATFDCAENYHETYLELFALIRNRDKTIARTFDDPKRSNAIIHLANMRELSLLTEDEFSQFSSDTREAVEIILQIRRE